jgi:hypothetical protein
VRHDADVADLGQVGQHVLCHGCLPTLSLVWLLFDLRPAVPDVAASGSGPPRAIYQR